MGVSPNLRIAAETQHLEGKVEKVCVEAKGERREERGEMEAEPVGEDGLYIDAWEQQVFTTHPNHPLSEPIAAFDQS
jgi:hypothetical protein